MTIGVDAGALSITDDRLKVGVYRVTKNALMALGALDKVNDYRLYTFGAIEEGILKAFEGRAKVVQLPKPGWQRLWLPIELKKHPVHTFLGFAQALPSVKSLCDVGFVYDVGFLYEPEAYGKNARILKNQTDRLVDRADRIVTISEATKADLMTEYALPAQNITVSYPGIDPFFSPAGQKHHSDRPYFLFVGSLNKAKDIPTLLSSFGVFCRRNNTADLVLIGGNYWPDASINATIHALQLENRVKTLGFVPDELLPAYYRGAIAFATTALREGFCLPAAEAMACGTPVVAMDRGALKEVVGEGGIIINQRSNIKDQISHMGEAMEKMMDKRVRERVAKKAIVQSQKFTWEKFGRQILRRIDNGSDLTTQGQAFQG